MAQKGGEGIMRNLLEAASLVGGVGRSASAGGRVEPTPFFGLVGREAKCANHAPLQQGSDRALQTGRMRYTCGHWDFDGISSGRA